MSDLALEWKSEVSPQLHHAFNSPPSFLHLWLRCFIIRAALMNQRTVELKSNCLYWHALNLYHLYHTLNIAYLIDLYLAELQWLTYFCRTALTHHISRSSKKSDEILVYMWCDDWIYINHELSESNIALPSVFVSLLQIKVKKSREREKEDKDSLPLKITLKSVRKTNIFP